MPDFLVSYGAAVQMAANHFYVDVPPDLIAQIDLPVKISEVDGKSCIGSMDPIACLADYEVNVASPDLSIQQQVLLNTKQQVWENIKALRTDKSLNSGVLCDGKWFNTDVVSRTQYERYHSKATALLASDPTTTNSTVMRTAMGPTYWKTMDNTMVPMTVGLIMDLMTAIENHEAAVFYQAEFHKGMMWNSSNPGQYDYTTGWPPSYGDS